MFAGKLRQERAGAGWEVRRTKFPVSAARRSYFQIEAGLFFFSFFFFFNVTRRKLESPTRSRLL